MLVATDVAAVAGKVEGRIRLAVLPVAVGQLRDERCLVPTLRPRLPEVQANRDDLRIWLVSANRSSTGNRFVNSNTRIASSYARSYTIRSFADLICIPTKISDRIPPSKPLTSDL
jgi:hypothetical protein